MTNLPKRQVGVVINDGNFQGLGLLRSLGSQNVPVYVLDTGHCIARYSRYATKYLKCPGIREEARFLEFLLNLAEKDNLKGWLVYPNCDETVCFLARHRERLSEYYRVTTPPWEIVRYAYDKMLTYKLAEEIGIPIPATHYPADVEELHRLEIRFPAIIKPSVKEPFYSRTKKKAILVENEQQLIDEFTWAAELTNKAQVLMVQELIPGKTDGLFSVGSLSRDGELLARIVAQRPRQHPMDFGHATTFAKTVAISELEDMAGKILAAIRYSGLSEVEFMFDPRDGKYKLIEINARPWGWHTLAIGAGVDLPYLSYLDMLGEEIKYNGYIPGVKWIRLVTDIPTVFSEISKGRMKLTEYLDSFKGKKQYAVWSLEDPLPFFMELALLPYLWKKRGF